MRILGIETSCDETAAAVVEDGCILSQVIASQALLHGSFAGVVPELASRAHLENIPWVVEEALRQAAEKLGIRDKGPHFALNTQSTNGRSCAPSIEYSGYQRPTCEVGQPRWGARDNVWKETPGFLDAVAYTRGPGLAGALLVGKVAAQAIALGMGKPLFGIHHLEGHIFAADLEKPLEFPLVALIVSGGHTDLVLAREPGCYRILGRTRDDAAGEAFDKVAKLLRLGYPGGPVIDRIARQGDPSAVAFPRPLLPGTWDFSFSGLKTAVVYYLRDRGYPMDERVPFSTGRSPQPDADTRCYGFRVEDVAASFQEAAVDTLVEKACAAAAKFNVPRLLTGGGVAANSRLREKLEARARRDGLELRIPSPALCMDNGAMIAQVAWHRIRAGWRPVRKGIDPNLPFENWARKANRK